MVENGSQPLSLDERQRIELNHQLEIGNNLDLISDNEAKAIVDLNFVKDCKNSKATERVEIIRRKKMEEEVTEFKRRKILK